MRLIEQLLALSKEKRQKLHCGFLGNCRLASEVMQDNRTAVIIVKNYKEYQQAIAIARLFSQYSASDLAINLPVWEQNFLGFAPTAINDRTVNLRNLLGRSFWAKRLTSLYALLFKKPCVIVVALENLLIKYPPLNFFEQSLALQVNAEMGQELLMEQLVEWGYVVVPMVQQAGEIAKRGDILDIFPTGFNLPVRLEFFGDLIDQMRLFNLETQRSLANLDKLTLLPTLPFILNAKETKDIRQRFNDLYSQKILSENASYSAKKALLGGGLGLMPGTVYANSSLFEDWLPKDAIWFLPDSDNLKEEYHNRWQNLKEFFEDEENEIVQPASLCLRDIQDTQKSYAWERFDYLESDSLRSDSLELFSEQDSSDNLANINLAERQIANFSSLFPEPNSAERPWQYLCTALKQWQREKRQVLLAFASERGRKKFLGLAEQDDLMPYLRFERGQAGIFALIAPILGGVEFSSDQMLILGEDVLQPHSNNKQRCPSKSFKGLDSLDDLQEGSLLVHRDYGVGRFIGLVQHLDAGMLNDFLLIEYADKDQLYLPVDRMALVQRFKTEAEAEVSLDRLGSNNWSVSKEKARKAIEKIAADLVEMYAYRKVVKSFSYAPPDELYHEFEITFGFEETPDQAKAIQDVLEDMAKPVPMDRLVCGDVGFGKTEVALRAAFLAVSQGRQVAMLCPTTILAEQHYQNFKKRLAGFPVNVGMLSRFVTKPKQKEVLKATANGQIDILIGTHRLLSNDVQIPNLALLVLDEEQRFGVRHKDKLKSIKKNVDVLTLTATPIPRTLQLSMSGIRDLSVIETAPLERKAVETAIIPRDATLLKKALQRELARNGQVFWVHNRIHNLEKIRDYISELVPEARLGIVHGQMSEADLEEAIHKFWHAEIDILICTAIVESGLDFPRANTLIVDQAQMFGLGQLYQLRGRVGRSDLQAYSFFVVPDQNNLPTLAAERLKIISELDWLGAGFQLAMEDLRMRGAGNILGEVQSGHIGRIGLDMYLEMLENAVARLKNEPQREIFDTEMSLAVPANIPEKYIADARERLRYYKSLAAATSGAVREEIALEMRDRFGQWPEAVSNFLAALDLKQFLSSLQVAKAEIATEYIRLFWQEGQKQVSSERLFSFLEQTKGARLLPPGWLVFPLDPKLAFEKALVQVRLELEKLKSDLSIKADCPKLLNSA